MDLTGQRFGRLVVVCRAANDGRGKQTCWLCRCDCGRESSPRAGSLKNGNTTSCGCAKTDSSRARRTHGGAVGGRLTPEYTAWRSMLARCHRPTNCAWANYGGRGITVCPKWRASYAAFLADMGPRPSPIHSLDRIDNDGNYEPGNCRWATNGEQSRNTRNVVVLEYGGERLCITDWAIRAGMQTNTLRTRLRSGWPLALALTAPVDGTKRHRRAA